MTDRPETRYTRSADGTNLAYRVSGDGPLDLVFDNAAMPIDLLSQDPGFVRSLSDLAPSPAPLVRRPRRGASEGDPRDSVLGEFSDADLAWQLDYVLQDGLNLGQPYQVAKDSNGDDYTEGLSSTDSGTNLPWTPAIDGLRNSLAG